MDPFCFSEKEVQPLNQGLEFYSYLHFQSNFFIEININLTEIQDITENIKRDNVYKNLDTLLSA